MTARKGAILLPRLYAKLLTTWGRAVPSDCFIFLAIFKEFFELPRLRKVLSIVKNKRRASARKPSSAQKPAVPTRGASAMIGIKIGRDALLARVRCAETAQFNTLRVLGVDDFAFRKGQSYGTILVDQERRRVVDLLPDREAATLAN